MSYTDLCQRVTASIVEAIETGNVGRWSAPWHHNPSLWAPANAHTNKPYAGANIVSLAASALEHGFDSAWWSTYRQWSQLGAQVRRGERATGVVKWVPGRRRATDNDAIGTTAGPGPSTGLQADGQAGAVLRLVPRVYKVFNAAQVDHWEPPTTSSVAIPQRVTAAQSWIDATGAKIAYGFSHACYRIPFDRIEVPAVDQYDDPVDHVFTVAHELISAPAAGVVL